MRRFLPDLIQLIWKRRIDPGKVLDLTLPPEKAPEGYRAMDERRAIKTLSLRDQRSYEEEEQVMSETTDREARAEAT